jgi:hypothetical protein
MMQACGGWFVGRRHDPRGVAPVRWFVYRREGDHVVVQSVWSTRARAEAAWRAVSEEDRDE